MTGAETNATGSLPVYQCPECLRLFNAEGIWQAFPYRAFVPVSQVCGATDCPEVAASLKQQERDRIARRIERKRARCGKPQDDRRRTCRTPFKENDEDLRRPAPLPNSGPPPGGLTHSQEQSRFVAEGDGVSDCERMLEILFGSPDTGFRPDDPTRTSRGPWVSSHELKYRYKIETPNSRASQLRGSTTLEAHPLVKQFGLDIDCRRNPAEYSVCFKEHSERLQRERND